MTSVCHLIDGAAGWEQRVVLNQLCERLPEDRWAQHVMSIGAAPLDKAPRGRLRGPILPRVPGAAWLSAPPVRRALESRAAALVHAWGLHAAVVAQAATELPLLVELFDPRLTSRDLKLLRTLSRPRGFAVVCASATLRRRMIEGGVSPEVCVVIRPGVDFSLLTPQRRRKLRETLGISREHTALIAPPAVVRTGGTFEAFWAAELAHYVQPGVRVIVPGDTREVRRIRRLEATLPTSGVLMTPGNICRFEELIAAADVLVMAAQGDCSTTAIAWAMAAHVAIIGAADYSIAELVAHNVNGLLFKPVPGESRAVAIVRLLLQRDRLAKVRETARGQAYEVFGLRRCIDQHAQLYENLLSGVAPASGITDSAVAG